MEQKHLRLGDISNSKVTDSQSILVIVFVAQGTIDYLSDGLETLHYYTRENSAIIVTARSVPGNV